MTKRKRAQPKDTVLFNLNLPVELKEYLEKMSKMNFTDMTSYMIDMILADKNKHKL